ncbi:hypothetical protein T492DRAFT_1127495 [Pavlovales sp. CCMP2436]|nr:hypothetical protein T492DRAFT_1127495 [Pavlovales sp. CCMP2436]
MRALTLLLVLAQIVTGYGAGDSHQKQCESWAASGHCISNPHFMLGSCRSQCTHNLMDISAECTSWSEPAYMPTCLPTCLLLPLICWIHLRSCNASCTNRVTDAELKERVNKLEQARAEREARHAHYAERHAPTDEEKVEAARAGSDGAPELEAVSAEEVAAEAAAVEAEENYAKAEDAAQAVAEALAGKAVHEPAHAVHGDAPVSSPAETQAEKEWEADREAVAEAADRDAAQMRARGSQHLKELRDASKSYNPTACSISKSCEMPLR